jgi:hypothetical protein
MFSPFGLERLNNEWKCFDQMSSPAQILGCDKCSRGSEATVIPVQEHYKQTLSRFSESIQIPLAIELKPIVSGSRFAGLNVEFLIVIKRMRLAKHSTGKE